jgi:hypothetical protein
MLSAPMLAHTIVQFAGDAAALLVLAAHEPRGKLAQAQVAQLDRGGLLLDVQIFFLEFHGAPAVGHSHGNQGAGGHQISERVGKFAPGKGAPGVNGGREEVVGCGQSQNHGQQAGAET